MKSWLEGNDSGYWIDNISFDARMETHMMIDRALTLPMAALQMVSGQPKFSPNANLSNSAWLNSVLLRRKIKSVPNWRSSVRHTVAIYHRPLSNKLFGHFYRIINHKLDSKFGTWSNNDTWIAVFNISLNS